MTDDVNAELRRVLTAEQPFGPPDAAHFTSNVELLRLLYDPDNRIHERAERSGAPFVIGRKGAGKTAFVTAPQLRDGVTAVELPSADMYQGVFDVIRAIMNRSATVFPEHSARLWRHLAWCAVLSTVISMNPRRSDASRTVHDFASSLGGGKPPSSPELAVSQYLRRLHTMVDQAQQIGGLGELLNDVKGNGLAITDAIAAGKELLAASDKRVVVIVDSLERYTGVLPTDDSPTPERAAFEGLFQFVGKDGTIHDRAFDIRFAFPAELWPLLEKVSANPAKDFDRKVIAHWSARELVRLVGTRLAMYAKLHDEPQLASPHRDGIASTPLDYDDSRTILGRMLPPSVTNGIGGPEDVIAYVMRHTQLLPRHLILILNSIWEVHRSGDPHAALPVSNHAVVDGVRNAESGIVHDVLASYRQVHPSAQLLCERVIPNLRMVFSEGELHRAYNQNGIRKESGLDFRQFLRVMVEIGCIGAEMTGERSSRYVQAEFEYTRPGSLFIGADARLCLHPVFAEVYNCLDSTTRLGPGRRHDTKPVYPYGSDPTTSLDYRDAP